MQESPLDVYRPKLGTTWREAAQEFAEEVLEHGPSGYISPESCEAVAQTLLALFSERTASNDMAKRAIAAIWLVDTLLAEAGYSPDSSARHHLAAAKSMLLDNGLPANQDTVKP